MLNPYSYFVRMLRTDRPRPCRVVRMKKPRDHGRQPVFWPLGGKEPKPVPCIFSPVHIQRQFPTAIGGTKKEHFSTGKETK